MKFTPFLIKGFFPKISQHFCIHLSGHTWLQGVLGNRVVWPLLTKGSCHHLFWWQHALLKIRVLNRRRNRILGDNCLPCILYINTCEYFSFWIEYVRLPCIMSFWKVEWGTLACPILPSGVFFESLKALFSPTLVLDSSWKHKLAKTNITAETEMRQANLWSGDYRE